MQTDEEGTDQAEEYKVWGGWSAAVRLPPSQPAFPTVALACHYFSCPPTIPPLSTDTTYNDRGELVQDVVLRHARCRTSGRPVRPER